MKHFKPSTLNLIFALIALIYSLQINFNPPVWEKFSDPYDYLHQSKIPLSDISFYFPKKVDGFYPRPFTVPLFYKMANSKPEQIIKMQKFFYWLSAFILSAVLLLYINNTKLKLIFVVFWYLFVSWWNISSWANTLLSESISFSFLFLWIASFLYLFKTKKILFTILHIIILTMFSFTRDSWPYVLVVFYFLYLLSSIKWDKKMRPYYSIFLTISISLFFIQQHSANIGQRYRLPILNNIVFNILPNTCYLEWFQQKGMPDIEKLKKEYSNLDNYKQIYPLYTDSTYNKLFAWINEKGKSVYMEFLIKHPFETLLFNEKSEDLKKIFAHNIGYTGATQDIAWFKMQIFPLYNLVAILILFFIYTLLCYKEKSKGWFFPAVLIIVFTFNAIMLYNADSLEVERHLIFTNVMMQFTGILLTIKILDSDILFDFARKTLIFRNFK